MKDLPDENSKRFVAVLNKKIEVGRLFNALGHMSAGLAGAYQNTTDLCLLQYVDASNGIHPNISHFPFIILKADNSNQIRKLRISALEQKISFTDFTQTMIVGTSEAQLEATRATSEDELEYFGICMFGESTKIKELTKKFSLFS